MDVKEKYLKLKREYLTARGTDKKNQIFSELSTMMQDFPNIVAEAEAEEEEWVMRQAEKEKKQGLAVKDKLEPIADILPGAYIAKTYFGKSGSWFSQRLNCLSINGKIVKFTDDEISTLEKALHDIGQKFLDISLADTLSPKVADVAEGAPKESTLQSWIIPSNNNIFRVDDCLADRKVIFWRQYNNFAVGDSVYLYGSKPDSRIKFLMSVDAVDLPHSGEVDDKDYWVSEEEFNARTLHNRYMKLRLVRVINSEALNLTHLLEHGLKGAPQGAMRVTGELLRFILENA